MQPNRGFAEARWLVMDTWVWQAVERLTTPHGRSWLIETAVRKYLHDEQPAVLDDRGREASDHPGLPRTRVPECAPVDTDDALLAHEIQRRAQAILAQRLAAEAGTGAGTEA